MKSLFLKEMLTVYKLCFVLWGSVSMVFMHQAVNAQSTAISLAAQEINAKNLLLSMSKALLTEHYEGRFMYVVGNTTKSFEIQQNNDYQLKLDFVLPAYMWAKGCDIKKIYEITDIYEGNFVRGILRINSMIEDVISVAENLGYFNLKKIMEGYEEKLIRDVVTINSLYIC